MQYAYLWTGSNDLAVHVSTPQNKFLIRLIQAEITARQVKQRSLTGSLLGSDVNMAE